MRSIDRERATAWRLEQTRAYPWAVAPGTIIVAARARRVYCKLVNLLVGGSIYYVPSTTIKRTQTFTFVVLKVRKILKYNKLNDNYVKRDASLLVPDQMTCPSITHSQDQRAS